jgi:GT2 family glycosyltransferase
MLLSIITINYKNSPLTIECLKSLYKYHGKNFKENIAELIIVDNSSEDKSFGEIDSEIKKNGYKNIKIIRNAENVGFSKGCNQGASKALGKYLLFLNNDTLVEDNGIMRMVEYMEKNEDVAILGGQLKNPNGEKQASTGKFYTLFNTFLLLISMQRFGVTDKNPTTISEVDWVKGALLMIRKNIFEKLAGFDERIFMYTEDMELCYRAKLLGYKTYFYPDVNVIHQDLGSSNRSFAVVQIYKGVLYFFKKHRSNLELSLVKIMLYTKAVVAIMIGILTGNKYLTTTFRKAIQF